MKKCEKKTFIEGACLCELFKYSLHCILQKMPKKKNIHRFISWQNPVKIKINTPENSDNFNPVPAASTTGPYPTIISPLLQFYHNVQTEWQLCRPKSHRFLRSRQILVCTACPDELSKNLGSLR